MTPARVTSAGSGEAARRTGSQAVERALALLRSFESGPPTRSLSELAQQNGLFPGTAHRLLRALCAAGLLQQDRWTERYALGAVLVALGSRAGDALGISAARPVLESLAATTGESVNLGVRDGDHVFVLVCVPSARGLRFDQKEGTRVPSHASAMGKVLLAFDGCSGEVVDSMRRFTKLTESTITTRAALRRALEETQARGWAINDEEREPGVRTIAAPVRTADGSAVAAVAVQGPSLRMTDERIEEALPTLFAAADEVSFRLSHWGLYLPRVAAAGQPAASRNGSRHLSVSSDSSA
ncbi:MAG TPA: IclR family transcriptional regulator [Acidimicrobiales bacterium]|nr:IclR family transcriptional regulator [Acidimicrobiales bacterium]